METLSEIVGVLALYGANLGAWAGLAIFALGIQNLLSSHTRGFGVFCVYGLWLLAHSLFYALAGCVLGAFVFATSPFTLPFIFVGLYLANGYLGCAFANQFASETIQVELTEKSESDESDSESDSESESEEDEDEDEQEEKSEDEDEQEEKNEDEEDEEEDEESESSSESEQPVLALAAAKSVVSSAEETQRNSVTA